MNGSAGPLSFAVTYHLMNGPLLRLPLECKLYGNRIFVSVVFTLDLAQGLTHSRCSVFVEGREEGGWEVRGGLRWVTIPSPLSLLLLTALPFGLQFFAWK